MPQHKRNDDDVLHHCAVMWEILSSDRIDFEGRHGGFLIPRQVSDPIIANLRSVVPNLTSEEALKMALSPRLLLVDLAEIAQPAKSHDGRGMSEQSAVTSHSVWPSYSPAGEALATIQLTLRSGYDEDEKSLKQISDQARARIRSHVAQVFKRGFKISQEHAYLMCSGRFDVREGFAKTCEDLGLAAELERDLPKAPSAPAPRL